VKNETNPMTTPTQKEIVIEAFGKLIGSLISEIIIAGLLYAILHLLIGVTVTYLQVFGVVLILDFIKFYIKK
jgi:hypothetical protein